MTAVESRPVHLRMPAMGITWSPGDSFPGVEIDWSSLEKTEFHGDWVVVSAERLDDIQQGVTVPMWDLILKREETTK